MGAAWMEAAWIAKASWTLENYLPPERNTRMSRDLAVDKILTHVLGTALLRRCFQI
jgi:hypothetical protein